jgi:hypothetical protein
MAKQPTRSDAPDASTASRNARPKRTRTDRKAAGAEQVPPAQDQTAAGSPAGETGFSGEDRPRSTGRTATDGGRAAQLAEDRRSTSMSSEPSEEDIRLRAYQRYLERGGGHGMDFEDWLEAERELKTRR